jgi:hypothetical protein
VDTWPLLPLLDDFLKLILTIYLRCVLSFLAGWLAALGWVEWVFISMG